MIQIKVEFRYEVLLLLLKKDMHQRELAKELKTSLTRVQFILRELRAVNVLDYRVVGRNYMYFIKKNLVSKSFILCAEQYKFAKFLRKYPLLEPLFKEIIGKYPHEMILLFGSYAKGIAKEESDIDIYVDTRQKKIKEVIAALHDGLSVHIREFHKEDLLIKEIIRNHVVIQGGESFYEKLGLFT